jgi:hypothetical protein
MAASAEQIALAADPSTDAQTLADLAHAESELWPAIAAHPNAYPGLIDWMHENGLTDAAVTAAPVAATSTTTEEESLPPRTGTDASAISGQAAKPRPKVALMAAVAGAVVIVLAVGGWFSYSALTGVRTSDRGAGTAGVALSSATDYRFGAKQTWQTKVNDVEQASDGYASGYAKLQSYPGLWLVSWPGDDSGSGRLASETLLGLDPDTGSTKWSMSPGPYECASALAAGALACVDTSKATLQILDPATGKATDSSLNGTSAESVKVFDGDIVIGYETSSDAGVVDTLERVSPQGTVVWNKSNTCSGYTSDDGMQFSPAGELDPYVIKQAKLKATDALLYGVCLEGSIDLDSGAINPNAVMNTECERELPFDDNSAQYTYGGYCLFPEFPMLVTRSGSTIEAITESAYRNYDWSDGSTLPTLWSAELPGATLSGQQESAYQLAHLGAYALLTSGGNLYGIDTQRGPTWENSRAFTSDGQILLLPVDSTKPNTPVLAVDLNHDTVARLDPSFGAARVSAEPAKLPACPTGLTPVSFSTWDNGAGATLVCRGFSSTVTVILIIGGKTYTSTSGTITPTGYQAGFPSGLSVDIGFGGWAAWVTDSGTTTLHAATNGWQIGDARASSYPALSSTVKACPAGTFPLSLSTWNGGWLLTCGEKATAITKFIYADGSTHGTGNAMTTQGGQSCGTDSTGVQVCVSASPAVVTFSPAGSSPTQHSADANYVVGKGFSGAGKGTGAYGLADPAINAASQVAYLNGILQQSQAARASIRTVIQNILKCGATQADVQSAQAVVAARTTELQALNTAPVDAVPGGAALLTQLRTVLQDSLTADQAYVTAANQVASGQCPDGKATYNAQKSLIDQITSEKGAFTDAWNGQIAPQYGTPTYTEDDI